MKRRRTEVVLEFEEVVVKRAPRERKLIWCEDCCTQVQMISADEAAIAAGVSTRTIYQWIESGKTHFVEMTGGRLLVCTNSLACRERARKTAESFRLAT